MLRPKDILFGEIALVLKVITRKQLAECIAFQKKESPRTRIGLICQQKGYMTPDDVERVLSYQVALMIKRGR